MAVMADILCLTCHQCDTLTGATTDKTSLQTKLFGCWPRENIVCMTRTVYYSVPIYSIPIYSIPIYSTPIYSIPIYSVSIVYLSIVHLSTGPPPQVLCTTVSSRRWQRAFVDIPWRLSFSSHTHDVSHTHQHTDWLPLSLDSLNISLLLVRQWHVCVCACALKIVLCALCNV